MEGGKKEERVRKEEGSKRGRETGVEGRKWGLLIEWIREYVVSGSQAFTCDIGEVGISFKCNRSI